MAKYKHLLFSPDEWLTPNSYNNNFSFPPEKPGVYLIVHPVVDYGNRRIKYKILYVGQSKNLHNRYAGHLVKKLLSEIYDYIQFYFKETDDHIKKEKELIKLFQPKFNTLHK